MNVIRKKLIEVSLPLEEINAAAEKDRPNRKGHPWRMHGWFARRRLACARAILFAQLVDDPSSRPDRFPTEKEQSIERERLHKLIVRLVDWNEIKKGDIIKEAQREILDSTNGKPPTIIDPFAGGGSIPIEAQRLGLPVRASDLNPVAVLINKALLEIPVTFKDRDPIHPSLADSRIGEWKGAEGLAADIRQYGEEIEREAREKIGNLYPPAILSDGTTATSIGWIWARTVTCPNPQCGIEAPLVRSWWLGKKKGRATYIKPEVVSGIKNNSQHRIDFRIITTENSSEKIADGTMSGRTGATCLSCKGFISKDYIKSEGTAGRLRSVILATVAKGQRRRLYLEPSAQEIEASKNIELLTDPANYELSYDPRNLWTPPYGLKTFSDLFTKRQLASLETFSELIKEYHERILTDALAGGIPRGNGLEESGKDALAYADSLVTYLALALSRGTEYQSTITTWHNKNEQIRNVFARHTLPMSWDYIEVNPLSGESGSWMAQVKLVAEALDQTPASSIAKVEQKDAISAVKNDGIISTDPPYFDNIAYSDLSDFFYVWIRKTLLEIHPKLVGTMLVPKSEELVANPYRQGGKVAAEEFFEEGFRKFFAEALKGASETIPITLYYAFKQSESSLEGDSSTGWQTILQGLIDSGWMVTATWPMDMELSSRTIGQGTNALASCIVLSLRPRSKDAPTIDRRKLLSALSSELPASLKMLQRSSVAPVDLPQSAIGPGMAIFSRYSSVIESDGKKMGVQSALARINEVLDEVLSEQEGDFDAATRFGIAWYRQHGYSTGKFGDADNMARARNASVDSLDRSGILTSRAGKVSLIQPSDLSEGYDPVNDPDISIWEVLHHLIRILDAEGLVAAGSFLARTNNRKSGIIEIDLVKELAFLLYSIADGNKWTKDAISFNNVATSWSDTITISKNTNTSEGEQGTFDYENGDEDY